MCGRSSWLVLAFVVVAVPSVALADGRVALVVGNSTYAHIGRLPNPDNDAADMSAALRRLGFEVTTEFDADRGELTEALRAFTRRSAGADVSLVFYAGHGIEMDGVNYLVPVDARLERDVDVRFESVTVDDLLVSTSGASLRLVILDACRNNPLARSMQRTAATRTVTDDARESPRGRGAGARPPGVGVGGPCRRSGGAGRWQQHLLPHRAAPEPGERRRRHSGRVAAARVRGDDRAGCGPHVAERGVAGLHPRERGGGTWRSCSTPATAWRWTA